MTQFEKILNMSVKEFVMTYTWVFIGIGGTLLLSGILLLAYCTPNYPMWLDAVSFIPFALGIVLCKLEQRAKTTKE